MIGWQGMWRHDDGFQSWINKLQKSVETKYIKCSMEGLIYDEILPSTICFVSIPNLGLKPRKASRRRAKGITGNCQGAMTAFCVQGKLVGRLR